MLKSRVYQAAVSRSRMTMVDSRREDMSHVAMREVRCERNLMVD